MCALKESFVIQLSNKKNFHKKNFFFDMPKSGQIFKEALFVNSNRRLKRAKRHSPIFPTPTPPQQGRSREIPLLALKNICETETSIPQRPVCRPPRPLSGYLIGKFANFFGKLQIKLLGCFLRPVDDERQKFPAIAIVFDAIKA